MSVLYVSSGILFCPPLIIIGVIGWILYERRKGQKELLQKQKEWEEEDLRRSEDENRDPD